MYKSDTIVRTYGDVCILQNEGMEDEQEAEKEDQTRSGRCGGIPDRGFDESFTDTGADVVSGITAFSCRLCGDRR